MDVQTPRILCSLKFNRPNKSKHKKKKEKKEEEKEL
jgi:hypothetical protein